MDWHATLAYYSKRYDAIKERRVTNFNTVEEALSWLNSHQNKPVYIWHTNVAMLDDMSFGMCMTDAYTNLSNKIINK